MVHNIFTVLVDPNRRHILKLLGSKGTLSATNIGSRFHVSPSAISQHLQVLTQANLLHMKKEGQHRMYSLNLDGFKELEDWIRSMKE